MNTRAPYIYRILVPGILALLLAAAPANAVQVSFMGRLANFSGVVPSLWSKIAVDKERAEVITLNPRQRDVRIFNEAGMEIYSFGENVELAGATDIELGEDGDMYLVFPRRGQQLLRLDYKGEPKTRTSLQNIPTAYLPFEPSFIKYVEGRIFLADANSMDVIVTDTDGVFQEGFHVKKSLMQMGEEFDGEPGGEVFQDSRSFKYLDIAGFNVDKDGNIYFTISTLFSAFKLPANSEQLQMFGTAGSGPGKFGVVAGIDTDVRGNIYVTDRLRSVVMIFDANFSFITEFGYRGVQPGRLMVPDDVTVDDRNGYIYVAQAAKRGVSVFRIIED